MNWRSLTRDRSLLIAAGVLLVVAIVWAVTLAAPRPPETLDQRVTDVASQLQCLQCQGESVADSSSQFALDVRGIIRTRLRQGESEQQVMNYLVGIYGDQIREVPPRSGFTLLIWLGPLVMLLVGIAIVAGVARQWRGAGRPQPVAADERFPELDGLSESELAQYRALLAAELAEEPDPPAPFPATAGSARDPNARDSDASGRVLPDAARQPVDEEQRAVRVEHLDEPTVGAASVGEQPGRAASHEQERQPDSPSASAREAAFDHTSSAFPSPGKSTEQNDTQSAPPSPRKSVDRNDALSGAPSPRKSADQDNTPSASPSPRRRGGRGVRSEVG